MENITLESVEAVMEQAQAEFPEAKRALVNADGEVASAVEALRLEKEKADAEQWEDAQTPSDDVQTESEEEDTEGTSETEDNSGNGQAADGDDIRRKTAGTAADDIVARLKKLVRNGNVDHIVISRKGETILNIPVNVGLVGSVIGLAAAPWAMIAGAVAAYGLSCRIEVVKKDGTKEEV